MKCNECGFESELAFSYCPRCGAGPQNALVSQNTAAAAVLAALKDNLFLVICILMSASCILSLAADGLPLLNILITVFLWLTYSQSRKDIADEKHLRCVSGTVYAQYVITYVTAVLLLVTGVIFAVAFSFLADQQEIMNTLLDSVIEIDDMTASLFAMFASASGILIMVIFALIAIAATVLNIFSVRYIHRFAKSVYQSIETGELNLRYPNAAQIWLFIFGAFSGLSALTSLATGGMVNFLCSAVDCTVCILSGLLIRKYLNDEAL